MGLRSARSANSSALSKGVVNTHYAETLKLHVGHAPNSVTHSGPWHGTRYVTKTRRVGASVCLPLCPVRTSQCSLILSKNVSPEACFSVRTHFPLHYVRQSCVELRLYLFQSTECSLLVTPSTESVSVPQLQVFGFTRRMLLSWCCLAHTARSTVCSDVSHYCAASVFRVTEISSLLHRLWILNIWVCLSLLLKRFGGGTLRLSFVFWPISAAVRLHKFFRFDGPDWPQIVATFMYSRHSFTSASLWTKFSHPEDESSTFLRNDERNLSPRTVKVDRIPPFER